MINFTTILSLYSIWAFNIQIVDPVIDPYMADFIKVASRGCDKSLYYPDTYDFGFVPSMEGEEIGVCIKVGNTEKIEIDRQMFSWYDDDHKRALIYHELTHCLMTRFDHSKDKESYMYPMIIDLTREELEAQVENEARDYCKKVK